MASDSETEIYLSSDEAFARPGLWWRGIYCGAIAGLLVGLADAALAQRAGNQIVGAADVLPGMGG